MMFFDGRDVEGGVGEGGRGKSVSRGDFGVKGFGLEGEQVVMVGGDGGGGGGGGGGVGVKIRDVGGRRHFDGRGGRIEFLTESRHYYPKFTVVEMVAPLVLANDMFFNLQIEVNGVKFMLQKSSRVNLPFSFENLQENQIKISNVNSKNLESYYSHPTAKKNIINKSQISIIDTM
jgi:hypothetical protein